MLQDFFLVPEIKVERSGADARLLGNVIHSGVIVPLFAENRDGGIDDILLLVPFACPHVSSNE